MVNVGYSVVKVVRNYIKELKTISSWIPASQKEIAVWRENLADARKQERDFGKEMISILKKFMLDNPDLYEERFSKYPYDDPTEINYSRKKKAFRIKNPYGFVYLVPILLLEDPLAYRKFRIKYLADKARKKDGERLAVLYKNKAIVEQEIAELVNKD